MVIHLNSVTSAEWILLIFCLAGPLRSFSQTGETSTVCRSRPAIVAQPWPKADTLFRNDRRWLGSDDAYSIDLGSGRVLWLFADTFIAMSPAGTRRESTMIRNSLAIQQGYDPSCASVEFYWGSDGGRPASFFLESPQVWYWPGHGIRLGEILLIFLMKVRSISTGLGFDVFGWAAVAVANPGTDPSQWHVRWTQVPENDFGVIVGSAGVLQVDDWLYAFGADEPSHDVYLVRWPKADVPNLSEPQWWCGEERGWLVQPGHKPCAVFCGGQTEFTVHFDPELKCFVQIQTEGFGAAEMSVRWADKLTGPWSKLEKFYSPPERHKPGVFIYAGKAHPELVGGDLVLTYVVNHSDFGQLVADDSIYYPRFVKAEYVFPKPR